MSRVDHAPPHSFRTTWSSSRPDFKTRSTLHNKGVPLRFQFFITLPALGRMGMYSQKLQSGAIHTYQPSHCSLSLALPRALSKDPPTTFHGRSSSSADRTSFGTKRHTHHDPSAYRNYRACVTHTAFPPPHTEHPEARIAHTGRTSTTTTQFRPVTFGTWSCCCLRLATHIPNKWLQRRDHLLTTISAASLCIVLDWLDP